MIIACPKCREMFQFDGELAAELTCPYCLRRLDIRPKTPPPYPKPLRVLPVDGEVMRDQLTAQIFVAILCALIVGGFGLILYGISTRASGASVLFDLALIFGGSIGVGIVEWTTRGRGRDAADVIEYETAEIASDKTPVLSYHTPARNRASDSLGTGAKIFGQAIGGVVLGLGGIIFSAWARAIPLLLIIPVLGIVLLFVRGIRGLGIGLVLAIPFGLLIIIGICGLH